MCGPGGLLTQHGAVVSVERAAFGILDTFQVRLQQEEEEEEEEISGVNDKSQGKLGQFH